MSNAPNPLEGVLAPQSVAVIGASDDIARIGGRPVASMLRAGYPGRIYPVNPGRETIQGLRCLPDIAALPEAPDAALVAVPAKAVAGALEELGQRGCRTVTLFSAGFSETGPDGHAAQNRILDIAQRYGMRLLGPNTLGVYNTQTGYFGTFSSAFDAALPLPGNIGIASQSGAFGAHLSVLANSRLMGTSVFVATGNEADLTVADAIVWMAGHPETDVICAYLEAINNGPQLLRGLNLARVAGKPVIILKAGSSALGAKAATSHTASLAGDHATAKAVLEDSGAILVQDLDSMMDIAYLASKKVFPKVRSLGVVTVSGGAGIVASDEAERLGLPLPPMPEDAQDALKKRLPFSAARNPLDCTAQAVNDLGLLEDFMRAALERGGYGAVLCFLTYVAGSPHMAEPIIETMTRLLRDHPDRLVTVCALGDAEVLRRYDAAGISVFADPVRAVRAIDAVCRCADAFLRAAPETRGPDPGTVTLPSRTPNEAIAKHILGSVGIPFPREIVADSPEAAAIAATEIGFPVVIKILSADIQHKSEIGGVRLHIASADEARAAYTSLEDAAVTNAKGAVVDGVLVAEQCLGGVECFMGIKRDPAFGPVAAFGLGGIFVEVLGDVALRKCPFDVSTAQDMILSTKAAPILRGARGAPPSDIAALAEYLSKLSHFAAAAEDRLLSIDLNPVVAMPKGQGIRVLDALIEIEER